MTWPWQYRRRIRQLEAANQAILDTLDRAIAATRKLAYEEGHADGTNLGLRFDAAARRELFEDPESYGR